VLAICAIIVERHFQAYDDRIQRAQLNKQAWDEERERRSKEREEWARQAKERSEARMKARGDLYENIRKIKEEKEMHAKLVEQFHQELRDRNPEWEIRRQEVLRVPVPPCSSTASSYDPPCSAKKCERWVSHPCDSPPVSYFLWPYSYIPTPDPYLFQTCCTIIAPLVVSLMHFYPTLSFESVPLRSVYIAVDILLLVHTGSILVQCDTLFVIVRLACPAG
jgi:hypothetical protein